MKGLISVVVGAALLLVVYKYYLQKMPSTDEGTAPTQAISLTGVRSDLLQIAQAERTYIATNGHCASLDELISSNSLSVPRTGRDGYLYSVECSGGEFTASARHLPAPPGSPIRYPNLRIDANMQVGEIN
jgi:Tfp pilus assembly protein PilE